MAPGALPFDTTQNLLLSAPPLKSSLQAEFAPPPSARTIPELISKSSLQAEFAPPPSATTVPGLMTSSHKAKETAPSPNTIEAARAFGLSINPRLPAMASSPRSGEARSQNDRLSRLV